MHSEIRKNQRGLNILNYPIIAKLSRKSCSCRTSVLEEKQGEKTGFGLQMSGFRYLKVDEEELNLSHIVPEHALLRLDRPSSKIYRQPKR